MIIFCLSRLPEIMTVPEHILTNNRSAVFKCSRQLHIYCFGSVFAKQRKTLYSNEQIGTDFQDQLKLEYIQ